MHRVTGVRIVQYSSDAPGTLAMAPTVWLLRQDHNNNQKRPPFVYVRTTSMDDPIQITLKIAKAAHILKRGDRPTMVSPVSALIVGSMMCVFVLYSMLVPIGIRSGGCSLYSKSLSTQVNRGVNEMTR